MHLDLLSIPQSGGKWVVITVENVIICTAVFIYSVGIQQIDGKIHSSVLNCVTRQNRDWPDGGWRFK